MLDKNDPKVFVATVIMVINIIIHSLGIHLLRKTMTSVTSQKLLIFHISLTACLSNFIWLVNQGLLFTGYDETSAAHAHNFGVELMLEGVLYMLMMFMTVDRLCAVVLSLKYPQYWGVKRTKIMLLTIWVIGVSVLICFQILTYYYGVLYAVDAVIYMSVAASLLFVVVAIVTYIVIFWKFKKSRDAMRRLQGPQGSSQSSARLVKSKFYIPVLIIFTYLVFAAIPYIWSIGLYIGKVASDSDAEITIIILWVSGYMCDGIIYIFFQRDVRKQLYVLVRSCTIRTNNRTSQPHMTHADRFRGTLSMTTTSV